MTQMYLIRHAEAEGNLYRIAHGHYDSLITERGYRQIAALRERFAQVHIDAVYASDLFRTRTTARSIYEPKGVPLHTTAAFREVGIGVWEGRTWQELAMTEPEELYRFNRDMARWHVEGAETVTQVLDRFIPALRQIGEQYDGKTVAIFSHGTALRLVLGILQGLTMEEINQTRHADNTAVSFLTFESGQFHVIFRDNNSHLLSEELSTLARQTWWKDKRMSERGEYYEPMTAADRRELRCCGAVVPEGGEVIAVHYDDRVIGGLQLLPDGIIGWHWLRPDYRGKGLGVPPLGQAIQYYRARGMETLRLRCDDAELRRFFESVGFVSGVGNEMIKYIGYRERELI